MIKVVCKYPAQIESWYDLYTPPIIKSKLEKGSFYYIPENEWKSGFREVNVYPEPSLENTLGKYDKICFLSINDIRINSINKIFEE